MLTKELQLLLEASGGLRPQTPAMSPTMETNRRVCSTLQTKQRDFSQ